MELQHSAAPRLLLPGLELGRAVAQDWPQIYASGAIWRVRKENVTLFPKSERDCSSGTSSYCATHLGTGPTQSWIGHRADPAQLLLQL